VKTGTTSGPGSTEPKEATLSSETYQWFTIQPRDDSMPFGTAEEIVRATLSSIPNTKLEDSDPKNRIVFISVADGRLNAVRDKLEALFRIDPDAPLKY
jgi:hypothetical protein